MGMRWLRLRLGTLTYEDWLLFCFAVRQPRWHLAVPRCRGVSWEQRAPSEAETGE